MKIKHRLIYYLVRILGFDGIMCALFRKVGHNKGEVSLFSLGNMPREYSSLLNDWGNDIRKVKQLIEHTEIKKE